MRSRSCPDARRGLAFYIRAANTSRSNMGQPKVEASPWHPKASCKWVHFLVERWRARAHEARLQLKAWQDEWNWQAWLPDKFARVGACETGYGKRPGDFRWDSGTYVSFMGIYRPAYEAYHRWTGRNTPREQYEVAAAIQAKYGWGAWGCGNA